MQDLTLFLPCAAGTEDFLADEVHALTGAAGDDLLVGRGGVLLRGSWRDALLLNLHSRIAQRVLVELGHSAYRHEGDLYDLAHSTAWEAWFTPAHTFKVEVTARDCPLTSLNFAALRIKDAVADRFRARRGSRPSVDTRAPDVRIHLHLGTDTAQLYIDTSGAALFKRGWRSDTGDAPLKETLAAAMLAAIGWNPHETGDHTAQPLYDPCCGSGTIVIEAAQMALRIAPGLQRRFGFEKLLPCQPHVWATLREAARDAILPRSPVEIFGSDVAHRMVDFAQRNAERAAVAAVVQLRGGDALHRKPPTATAGVLLLNPPYGERIAAAGMAGQNAQARAGQRRGRGGRERAVLHAPSSSHSAACECPADESDDSALFFQRLGAHWKTHYAGWTAWLLTPDMRLPAKLRLKETRRTPLYNGPIECRLFRFDLGGAPERTTRRGAQAATPTAASSAQA